MSRKVWWSPSKTGSGWSRSFTASTRGGEGRSYTSGLCCGLATPTIAVICTAVVLWFDLGPQDARVPLSLLLVVFTSLYFLLVGSAIKELLRSSPCQPHVPVQFGIRSLLWTMVFVAVFFSCVRLKNYTGTAITLVIGYAVFVWQVMRSFQTARSRVRSNRLPPSIDNWRSKDEGDDEEKH